MGITRIQDQASGLRKLFHPDGDLALGQPVVHAVCCPARPALTLPLVQGLVHAWADQGYGLAWVDELDWGAREDWPWPCRVRFDLSQSMLDHVPLSASFSALDERVWFAGARHMQRLASGRGWPLSRRLQGSGVAFDAVYISVNPHSLRQWQVYGGRIHHTVVVGTARGDIEFALRWMTQVPTDSVASWRLLLLSPDTGVADATADNAEQAIDWITHMAAPLLGQPLEVLGPVAALWQGISLTAALPGVEAMRRVLLDRLMQD
jgi:hypothetical protein